MVIIKCIFHDKGFCKFGDICRYKHYSVICDECKCPNKSCEKRHPRICRFFSEHNYCKFGTYCHFRHDNPLLEKIKSLEVTLAGKESKIEVLVTEIKELKKLKNELFEKDTELAKYKANIFEIIIE